MQADLRDVGRSAKLASGLSAEEVRSEASLHNSSKRKKAAKRRFDRADAQAAAGVPRAKRARNRQETGHAWGRFPTAFAAAFFVSAG